MGRGNACVFGEYEGLFYVNWDNFASEFETEEDEDGNTEIFTNYDMQRKEWEYSLATFKNDFMKRFKSFSRCNKWLSNTERAVLENRLFYVAVEDSQWSMAIKLIQKEQDYYDKGNLVNLQAGKYQNYLDGMKDCLFEQFDTLGVYGGAWTSGTIKKCA